MRTKIIIVGAGPTGLMAACQLARFNCEMIIIDKKSGPTKESRAIIVTPRTLEIYRQMGLFGELAQHSKPVPKLLLFVEGKRKAVFNLEEAGQGITGSPEFKAFEQSKNEELLYKTLQASGRSVCWNTEFITVKQRQGKVTIQVKELTSGHTRPFMIQGDYLLACDGASSPVRNALRMKFAGGTYKHHFFVADTKISWRQPANSVIATPGRDNFCAFFPMKDDNTYRILGTFPKDYQFDKEPNFKPLKMLIYESAGFPLKVEEVNWWAVYRVHHRCTSEFRNRNCFLLGDAAHIHSPAGGQGMNTGLQDAHNIAWKLALVTRGLAGDHLLNSYHHERYPFARWLLKFTDRLFALMTGTGFLLYSVRKYLLPFFFNYFAGRPMIRKRIYMILSQLWYRYDSGPFSFERTIQKLKFRTGSRCPYVELVFEGRRIYSYELLNNTDFVIFAIGDFPLPMERELPDTYKNCVKYVNLPLSAEWQAYGVNDNLMILIRPDHYIGVIDDQLSSALLLEYFNSFF